MPGPRRMFGEVPARDVMAWLDRWRAAGLPPDDPIYPSALETLRAYTSHVAQRELDTHGTVLSDVTRYLAAHPARAPALETPAALPELPDESMPGAFAAVARRRRSMRDFLPQPVPEEGIARAVTLANAGLRVRERKIYVCSLYVRESP